MCRLRQSKKFNERSYISENIESPRLFYFAYEGNKTEPDYFKGVQDNKEKIGIHNLIEIISLDRDKNDTQSHPRNILDGVNEFFKSANPTYNPEHDEIWLIFDRENENSISLDKMTLIKKECKEKGYYIGLSNPCFEFWLLSHFEEIKEYDKIKLLQNEKISNKHNFISNELTKLLPHGYSKENIKFNNFIDRINLAIDQSKLFETDIDLLEVNLGTNIGLLFERLIKGK